MHLELLQEMACGISAACRGPPTERQKFLFKIFDRDRDGRLDRDELHAMVLALLALTIEERHDWDDGEQTDSEMTAPPHYRGVA